MALYKGYSARCLLAFVSHRLLRGGPRILFHAALLCLVFVIFTGQLPERLSEVVLGTAYTDLSQWGRDAIEHQKGTDLRIVVFGDHDIATPEGCGLDGSIGPSWTEVLCQELRCSSHISLVPRCDKPGRTFVSNSLYGFLLEALSNDTMESKGPGTNYTSVLEDYPLHWEVPDLKEQVTKFLSRPPPSEPPKETLWIFSFGTWDIWSLAAFPRNEAHDIIDALAMDVFNHVDRLYQASSDPASVAYSQGASSSSSFRVLIPQLFDPSLLPAWQMDRPKIPRPHSPAEQTRNAARLAEKWNHAMRNEMETWVKMEPSSEEEKGENTVESSPSEEVIEESTNTTSKRKRSMDYAQRDAIDYELPGYLLDVMVDRQLRQAGIVDAHGTGQLPLGLGFQDVGVPCIHDPDMFRPSTPVLGIETLAVTPRPGSERAVCDKPDRYLFYTSFTLGRRAIREIGRQAAVMVKRNETVRAFWDGIGQEVKLKRRGPGSWAEGAQKSAGPGRRT